MAFILGSILPEANALLDSLDGFIVRALFVMSQIDDDIIQAHITRLWDRYSDEQVKNYLRLQPGRNRAGAEIKRH